MSSRSVGLVIVVTAWAVVLDAWVTVPGVTVLGAQTGTISGRVSIDAGDVPEPVMLDVTADQAACGTQVVDRSTVVDADGGVENAVIIVTGVPWTEDPPPPVINNAQCYFEPRVQVVKPRSVVSIESEDTALHTTHAYDDRARTIFNLALPVPGMVIKRPLRRPGLVRLECDSHGWMRGWVYVTDDVATVSGPGGGFEIPGIPPGTYEVTVWHERYSGAPQTVTVAGDGATNVDFRLE